jgi:cytochrome c553
MNCDIAFELMTEPHGGRSLALREHLEQCPRCRQMQETLAPALEWLADVAQLPSSEFRSDSTVGSLATASTIPALEMADAVAIAQQSSERLSIRCVAPREKVRRWISTAVRSAALVAIGGFLALTVLSGGNPGDRSTERRAGDSGLRCRRHDLAADRAESRSPAEIRSLIATCAACHDSPQKEDHADRRRNVIEPRQHRLCAMALINFGLL